MTLTRDHLRRLIEVAHAQEMGFVELVGLAELDPAKAFRGVVARNIDMRGQDLAGFDFTGATFMGCDFRGADLSWAKGVTVAMLAESTRDETTRLPPASRAAFSPSGQKPAWAEEWDAIWPSGQPPSWVENGGYDQYGVWVSFRVPGTDVTQRMRRIPPGWFMMGSSKDDPGYYPDESPRHLVTIDQGFWMFETACREVLWMVVMDQPPRRSRGPEFPVTNVSWNDAQDFVKRLNAMLPGLRIGLPSEACWEYACRVGTETPYSFGESITKKQVCYGSQNPVAAGTLPPNQWGLYEMHGNVWEWCEDRWHGTYAGAPEDGAAWLSGGSGDRVIRGGSWFNGARNTRAAYRIGSDPSTRDDDVGFRCARVQISEQAERRSGASVPGKGR